MMKKALCVTAALCATAFAAQHTFVFLATNTYLRPPGNVICVNDDVAASVTGITVSAVGNPSANNAVTNYYMLTWSDAGVVAKMGDQYRAASNSYGAAVASNGTFSKQVTAVRNGVRDESGRWVTGVRLSNVRTVGGVSQLTNNVTVTITFVLTD